MKSTRSSGPWVRFLVLGGLAALVVAPAVRAGEEDDAKKAQEDLKKAQERQGQGQQPGGAPGGPGGQPGQAGPLGEENPLLKILELMKNVEDRLFETGDTGEFTQAEQRKVIEAMRFEDKTSAALEELIKKIEEQAKQSSSSSSSSQQQQQQKQQQQNQNETEQQKQERERQEQERQRQEKEQERQRQAQQQQQPQDQQQPQNDQERRAQQERRDGRPPEEPPPGDPRNANGSDRWGQLPAKLHQDAQNALNQDPPGRYRELIERYRARLASPSPDSPR